MNTVLVVLHVLVCFFLVIVVLLQRGKGAEMGAVFGGGASSTVFGGRGAGNFLTKLTTGSAIVFMCTSLTLSYFATRGADERLFEDGVEAEVVEQENLFEEVGTVAPEAAGGEAVVVEGPEADVLPTEAATPDPEPETP
jgi:preprotein translocase subunit SecG